MPRIQTDPLAEFTHCPRCGSTPLGRREERALACPACGFVFYINSAAAAAGLLLWRGELVLTVRAHEPQKGLLDFPGGFVEFDESAEEALRREVMEELNLEITAADYLCSAPNDYAYGGVLYKTTDLYFVCELGGIDGIKAGDGVAAYALAKPADLAPESLAFPSGRAALRRLLQHMQRR